MNQSRTIKIFKYSIYILLSVIVVWSSNNLSITWDRFINSFPQIARILTLMFPPDLSSEMLTRVFVKLEETIWIAWVGTIIGIVFSIPFGYFASSNLFPSFIWGPFKTISVIIRAIPELIIAYILIPVTGLGALTGTLAIGIGTIGTFGKWQSELTEEIEYGQREALMAVGASSIVETRWAVVPQILPSLLSFYIYRFEINIRASAILGLIGAGGIGAELLGQFFYRDYPKAGTVVLITVIVVIIIDQISSKIRNKIIEGQ